MICTSIQGRNLEELEALLQGGDIEMAEIRLDRCRLTLDEVTALFSDTDIPLVATYRCAKWTGEAAKRAESQLLTAIVAGARYVDLEIEAPALIGKRIREACEEYGTTLIRSWHDFTETPPEVTLRLMADRCRMLGAEVVKIVTTAKTPEDGQRVLWLYKNLSSRIPLIAFAMGEVGRNTRLECLRLGAPFTFAALSEEERTAPGQWTLPEMKAALYGRQKAFPIHPAAPIPMPSSKSFAQRAIVMAALAEGTSRLHGYTPCGDNEAAIAVAEALGAQVVRNGDTLEITGIAAQPGCLSGRLSELHTGESGLLTRLMIPLLSVLSDEPVRVTGEKTLLGRPLSNAHDYMAAFGVRLQPEAHFDAARPFDCYLPLTVCGPLIPGKAELSGKGGSQLVSGLLTALPLCAGDSRLVVEEPRSIPYLFITLDVLKQFGIRISSEMEGDEDFVETRDWAHCTAIRFRIPGGQRLRAAEFRIEGDWSGAANFLVAGAIFGEVEVSGLETSSLQADLSILDVLTEAGACISRIEEGEREGNLHITRAPLSAFDTDLNNCPDLFPIVALLAAFCPGTSHILGTGRLAHKETDRAAAIVGMLEQMGVQASIEDDCLSVRGRSLSQRLLKRRMLRGGHYTTSGDHRMVMALRVAALGADAPIQLDDAECVAKSFPTFNELFDCL